MNDFPVEIGGNRHKSFVKDLAALRWLVGVTLFIGGCGSPASVSPLDQARELAAQGKFTEAEAIVKAIPREDSRWPEAQVILGDIAVATRGNAAGIPYYEAIPRDGSEAALRAIRAVSELHYSDGLLPQAAESLEELLKHYPLDGRARSRLAAVYDMSGLRARAERYLFETLKTGRIDVQDLVSLTEPDRLTNREAVIRSRVLQHPEDDYANLGMARIEVASQQFTAARQRVLQIVKRQPELPEAQALLGELLLDGELVELEEWHTNLPASVRNDPGVWYVHGLWARRIDQPRVAARCFWETVRQSPTHRRAFFQLGQVLAPLDAAGSAAFSQRAALLKEYAETLEQVLIHRGAQEDRFERMITLLMDLGRDWEAWGWAMLSRDLRGPSESSERWLNTFASLRGSDTPRFREDRDLSRLHDLSTYPDFDSLSVHGEKHARTVSEAHADFPIRFTDEAADRGVNFVYFQSPDPSSKGVRIFESTGGGVGAFDFDLDGWIDLFLTQGQDWPSGQPQPVPSPNHTDRLYRGSGANFADVTLAAGLNHDPGYGQGSSCGDLNNDGFPDLYVANIGQNQLWQNNGDGTFTDITEKAGLQGADWTTSCLILDLNLDGHPDLYDVNYLQGDQIFSVECSANRCSVRGYQGAPDRVQLSRGDGTFVEVPDATPAFQAKGLGIVAMFIKNEPRPSLFIANDQVPNFFLRPTDVAGRYVDEAQLAGLAVNHDGMPTACMGVAAGDLNHDRKTDLFVTNYQGEAKVLYLQRTDGFFEDAIVGSGLMLPGIPYVGWGTQFLDADNNGDLDLVAANGHVANFGEPGVSYRMPTQFFRNSGRGQMVQAMPSTVGELFDRQVFGRAVARCDWNRDGRMDFVLSTIDSPAILATNHSDRVGHWLAVQLRARTTARDAIGTAVEIHHGETVSWQQLLAGDGYQATNERGLHFGLGVHSKIDRIVIHWPSGNTSTHTEVPIDQSITVVEGREALVMERP